MVSRNGRRLNRPVNSMGQGGSTRMHGNMSEKSANTPCHPLELFTYLGNERRIAMANLEKDVLDRLLVDKLRRMEVVTHQRIRRLANKRRLLVKRRKFRWHILDFTHVTLSPQEGLNNNEALEFLQQ